MFGRKHKSPAEGPRFYYRDRNGVETDLTHAVNEKGFEAAYRERGERSLRLVTQSDGVSVEPKVYDRWSDLRAQRPARPMILGDVFPRRSGEPVQHVYWRGSLTGEWRVYETPRPVTEGDL